MSNYFLSVGGTGHKILEALLHLCAAGLGPNELYVAFFDLDYGNQMLVNTKNLLKSYIEMRQYLYPNEENDPTKHNDSDKYPSKQVLFRTKIHASCSLDSDNLQTSIHSLEAPTREFKDLFFGTHTRESVLDFFYNEEEKRMTLDKGYRARPYIGSPFILSSFLQLKNGLGETKIRESNKNLTWKKFKKQIGDNKGDFKFFVAGSIFGGTGASCFPFIKAIINAIPSVKDLSLEHKAFASLMALPYFELPSSEIESGYSDEKQKHNISVNKHYVDYISKCTLNYYASSGKNSFDSYYLIGERGIRADCTVGADSGGGLQLNNPHFIELLAGLAPLNFYAEDQKEVSFLLKTPQIIYFENLPLPNPKDQMQFLYHFTLTALSSLYFNHYAEKLLPYTTWIQPILRNLDLKNNFTKIIPCDYFNRYCHWFYEIHKNIPQSDDRNHIIDLIPNLNRILTQIGTDYDPNSTFYISLIEKEKIFYKVQLESKYTFLTPLGKYFWDDIYVSASPNSSYINSLLTGYERSTYPVGLPVLNILHNSIAAKKHYKIKGKENSTLSILLPPTTSEIEDQENSIAANIWASQSKNLHAIAEQLDLNLDLEHLLKINQMDSIIPASYPVMFARLLYFRDHLLKNCETQVNYVKQWRCILSILALCKYLDYDVHVDCISLDSLPENFQIAYQSSYPKEKEKSEKTRLDSSYLYSVYFNGEPLALIFPDSIVCPSVKLQSVLEDIEWCSKNEIEDPLRWISSSECYFTAKEKVSILNLLLRWVHKVSLSMNSVNKDRVFTNDSFKDQCGRLFATWEQDICKQLFPDNTDQTIDYMMYQGRDAFCTESLLDDNKNMPLSDLFIPVRESDADESEIALQNYKGDKIVFVSSMWKTQKPKQIKGPIYTNACRYNQIYKRADDSDCVVRNGITFLLVEKIFCQRIGYCGGINEIHTALPLITEKNKVYLLPFNTSILDYFSIGDLRAMIHSEKISIEKNENKSVTVHIKNDGFTFVKKNYAEQDAVNIQMPMLFYYPDFKHPYFSVYELIVFSHVAMADSAIIEPYFTNSTSHRLNQEKEMEKQLEINTLQGHRQYFTSSNPFEIVNIIDPIKGYCGFIGLNYQVKEKPDADKTIVYALDFGTSNTTVYKREPGQEIKPHFFRKESLHVGVLSSEDSPSDQVLTNESIIPFFYNDEGGQSVCAQEFSSCFLSFKNNHNLLFSNGLVLLNEHFYLQGLRMLSYVDDEKFIKDNELHADLKWITKNDAFSKSSRINYLKQIVSFLFTDAIHNDYKKIEINYSYPLAMPSTENYQIEFRHIQNELNNTDKDSYCVTINNDPIDESTANVRYLLSGEYENNFGARIAVMGNMQNIVLDIGGGSSDIAYIVKNSTSLDFSYYVSSFDLGGRLFADCLKNQGDSVICEFVKNFGDKNWTKNIRGSKDLFQKLPAPSLNLILKHTNMDYVMPEDFLIPKIFLLTFFSGIAFYIGMTAGSLQQEIEQSFRIFLTGNGSKLLQFLHLSGDGNNELLHTYFVEGFKTATKNSEILDLSVEVFPKDMKSAKNEVAIGLLANTDGTFSKIYQKSSKITQVSIFGERMMKNGEVVFDVTSDIHQSEFNYPECSYGIIDHFIEMLTATACNIWSHEDNRANLVLKNAKEIVHQNKNGYDTKSSSLKNELIEPIFISELKCLLESLRNV